MRKRTAFATWGRRSWLHKLGGGNATSLGIDLSRQESRDLIVKGLVGTKGLKA